MAAVPVTMFCVYERDTTLWLWDSVAGNGNTVLGCGLSRGSVSDRAQPIEASEE